MVLERSVTRAPAGGEVRERLVRIAAITGGGLAVLLFLHGIPGIGLPSLGWDRQYRLDLDVYRLGAQAWLDGAPLYGPGFPVTDLGEALPFVYPPVAAVLFTPLTWASMPVVACLLTVASALVVPAVVAAVLRALGVRVRGWWLAAATPLVLLTDPVRLVLWLGQINIVLVGLVVAGLLGRGPGWDRWRGVPVGIAAAVKLTPLVFVVWFLLAGHRRAAAVAAGTFAGLTAAGAVLAPADTLAYWGSKVTGLGTGAGSVLDLAYTDNQSLRGVIARWGLADGTASWVWLPVAAAVGAVALVLARRCLRAGEPLLGVGVLAVAGLLASPISWSHHWVWAMPVLPVLAEFAVRRGRPDVWCVLGVGALSFALGPHWLLPHDDGRELAWGGVEQLVGAHLPLWGLAVLAVVARVPVGGRPGRAPARFSARRCAAGAPDTAHRRPRTPAPRPRSRPARHR